MVSKKAKGKSDVETRKAASIASMVVGAPNLLISLFTLIGGVGGLVFLVVFLVALLMDEQGKNDPMAGLCIVLFIVFVIMALVLLVIALVILAVLAFAISSQIIGGILAFKGKRFGLSIALMANGAVLTFILGVVLLLGGFISAINEKNLAFFPIVLWGAYNVFSTIVTTVCIIVISGKKHTFIEGSGKVGPYRMKTSLSSSR